LPGVAATGQTAEERERFRAGGVVVLSTADVDFEAHLETARATWADVIGAIEEALVPVLPE
jgi:hypothetical protein